MKNAFFSIGIAVITLAGCNSRDHKTIEGRNGSLDTLTKLQTDTVKSGNDTNNTISVMPIIKYYLQVKNSLAEDNSKEAAAAGIILEASIKDMNTTALSDTLKKTFIDIAETAIENAEHIGKNGGNIAHQREHFEMLSQDIYDLVKAFGSGEVLYSFFCPMYNEGKGASWISETKEIKNPYMGKSMPTCGTLKEEIK
jgi:hypothetical protein